MPGVRSSGAATRTQLASCSRRCRPARIPQRGVHVALDARAGGTLHRRGAAERQRLCWRAVCQPAVVCARCHNIFTGLPAQPDDGERADGRGLVVPWLLLAMRWAAHARSARLRLGGPQEQCARRLLWVGARGNLTCGRRHLCAAVYCAACEEHLGWRFSASRPGVQPRQFWGFRRPAVHNRSLASGNPGDAQQQHELVATL